MSKINLVDLAPRNQLRHHEKWRMLISAGFVLVLKSHESLKFSGFLKLITQLNFIFDAAFQ